MLPRPPTAGPPTGPPTAPPTVLPTALSSLALIDGWAAGVAGRLTTTDEYLHDVPRVGDIAEMLRTFSTHILTDQPGFWTTHVGAHPPGAFLVFVLLDRVGLGGGGPAGLLVVLVLGRTRDRRAALFALPAAAALAVVVADLCGLSKAEVERIWLPFGIWLVLACGWLSARPARGWLAAQAGLALAVNSLLLTVW